MAAAAVLASPSFAAQLAQGSFACIPILFGFVSKRRRRPEHRRPRSPPGFLFESRLNSKAIGRPSNQMELGNSLGMCSPSASPSHPTPIFFFLSFLQDLGPGEKKNSLISPAW